MGMFKMEKPRRFNHQYIYVDERKEKLQNWRRKPNASWVCFLPKNFLRRYPWKVRSRYQAFKTQKRKRA